MSILIAYKEDESMESHFERELEQRMETVVNIPPPLVGEGRGAGSLRRKVEMYHNGAETGKQQVLERAESH